MNRAILSLAIPNILSNISVPLLSSVDTALMGHLSVAYLSALGVGGMIFMFLYFIFGFLRMGTTSLVAQAYGAKDYRVLSLTLYRALIVAGVIALFITIFQWPILIAFEYFLNVDSNLLEALRDYYSIRIYSSFAVMALYVFFGFFFGVQNTKYPLFITLVINVANLLISIYLVKSLNMGIAGVAWGSVIAQYIGALLAIFLLKRYKSILQKPTTKTIFQKEAIFKFFNININIFIRTALLMLSLAFFYSQASKAGEETLSVMVLMLQFMVWFSFVVDGFANATEALVGRYFGAKDKKRLLLAIKLSTIYSAAVGIIFAIGYYFFMEEILSIFTDKATLINKALSLSSLVALFPLISFLAFVFDGVFIGLGAVKVMRDVLFASTALYILLFILIKGSLKPEVAIWGSFLLFFLFRSLFSLIAFRRRVFI